MTQLLFYAANKRRYHVALAHCIANTRLSDQERMGKSIARFQKLGALEQTLCRIEIAECRAAKRGQRLAEVK